MTPLRLRYEKYVIKMHPRLFDATLSVLPLSLLPLLSQATIEAGRFLSQPLKKII